ncbi:MAG TPA: TetR/AcrR family transcriptional regulator [Acidothermaceae bacterium]
MASTSTPSATVRSTVTTAATRTPDRLSARDRLLTAADELFYDEGVHTVGIDRIIERAGVAKASLYNTFGSKDELIRAYLEGRYRARQERVTGFIARYDTPRERLLGVFDALGSVAAEPGFRGCAFMNASAESLPGGPVEEVSDESRAWTRRLFTELAAAAGVADPAGLAEQFVLLYDGATVGARMDRTAATGVAARAIAETLLDAAPKASSHP